MINDLHERLIQTDGKPKLLVVDDQPLQIRLLHEIFRNDYELYMAMNGQQAIEKCLSIQPDLVLLDVEMPDMSGYEVCRILKNNPATAIIPIIFVTAHFEQSEEVKGFEMGASDFIHKPIDPTITRIRVKNHIALKKQQDFLQKLAMIDFLSGIPNRRHFDESFQVHWKQSIRDQTPLSIIMIDIDYFKRFNDHYGHQAGDECIRSVAQTIRQTLKRPSDMVARYGGEEFICVLPNTDLQGGIHIANEIRTDIQELHIQNAQSEIHHLLTISEGVASITPNIEDDPESLIETADQQLYIAKGNGRDRICAAEVEK